MAFVIWPQAYRKILSQAQLDYMLDMFYAPTALAEQMDLLKHLFIIAEQNNQMPVGFASFSPDSDSTAHWHLHKLYVLPAKQKLHIGKQLIESVIKEAVRQGGKFLQLNVNRHNAALGFYKKSGFAVIREEDKDIGRGFFMNDYVMQRKL